MEDPASILNRLASSRIALRESIREMETAIADCQEARRESVELLAELDSALRDQRSD